MCEFLGIWTTNPQINIFTWVVKYMVGYANSHAFSYVPQVVREQRGEKLFNQLESKGVIKPAEPYLCGVCERRFYNNDKLVNYFIQIHECKQKKRLNRRIS